jgi:AAA+ superfamily predicted ATPase
MIRQTHRRKPDDVLGELRLLVRSRYGLIWLRTVEIARAEEMLRSLAASLDMPLFVWSLSGGLRRADLKDPVYGTADPQGALRHIQATRVQAIYHLQGVGALLEDRALISRLTEVVRAFTASDSALVVTGDDIRLPEGIRPHSAVLSPPAPDRDDLRRLVGDIYRDVRRRMDVKMDLTSRDMNRLLQSLKGLSLTQAGRVLTRAMVEDGRLSADDLETVIAEKRKLIETEGLLEFVPLEHTLEDVADLASLKAWLAKRREIVEDPQAATGFGLTFPKGILLLGVPGAGKSLCAKAVAMDWGLPLVKLDPGRLYNKYVGESEKNFRCALEAAERLAPVILWIDEIEKAFSTESGDDGGVSRRVLGSFLSWMQERSGEVFIAATANDIERLPAEFLRKGRFDEIFFVDLPDKDTRREIFRIHISLRGHDPEPMDLGRLAEAGEGFTGAEIEQVVVSALYTCFSGGDGLSEHTLLQEIAQTRPLSVTRAEYVDSLRDWARGRTVGAQ